MPQPHDNARVFLVIILLLWLVSTPDTGPALISVPSLTSARLSRQRQAHALLNSTGWGDFSPQLAGHAAGTPLRYLNITGFREEDGYAWDDLDRFRERCLEWSRNANPSAGGKSAWDMGLAGPMWQNATGIVNGEWVRRESSVRRYASSYNLSEITPAVGWLGAHAEWGRNVTGSQGKILMRVDDKDKDFKYEEEELEGQTRTGGAIREVSATITLQDDWGSGSSWDMRLHGVHWPEQGAVLMTTTSEKFAGIFALPHLSPGPAFFKSSRAMLNQTLDRVLRKKEKTMFSDPSNPWSSSVDGPGDNWTPFPHCEYLLYAQIHPITSRRHGSPGYRGGARERQATLVKDIESELRYPMGAPVPETPELQMSAVIWSPDCAYFLESKGPPLYSSAEGQHLVGMKQEVFIYEAKIWLLAFAAVLFGQIQLLKTQMRESGTPSTMARVSFYTASAMLMADGLVFAGSSAWSLSASTTFLPALLVTFAAFLSMTIGGAFLSEVYKVQEPERRNRDRDQAQTASNGSRTPPTSAPPAARDSLPRPVTAGPIRDTATPPIIIPSDQDIGAEIAENAGNAGSAAPTPAAAAAGTNTTTGQQARQTTFSSITGRFVLLGTCILFISLASTSWPAAIRNVYVNMLAFLYLSLWVPQILRNIQRNSRRAFSWRFMIGQSVLRILPFAYFYLREDNIIFAEPDWYSFGLLAAWLWIQLWILAFQDALGPRFGIPRSWTPEAWDYHPVLREDNIEAGGLPIGLASTSAPGSPILGRMRSLSLGDGDRARVRERDRDRKRSRGWTLLHIGARKGDLKGVRQLLDEGMDANVAAQGHKSQGVTPLHLAAEGGHLKIMDVLLERGANIDARTKGACGWTPLHSAAKERKKHAVKFLIENGAFLPDDMNDTRFNPPLHYCTGLEWAYEEMKRFQQDSSSSGEASYSSES